jgi:hypothetical protein
VKKPDLLSMRPVEHPDRVGVGGNSTLQPNKASASGIDAHPIWPEPRKKLTWAVGATDTFKYEPDMDAVAAGI